MLGATAKTMSICRKGNSSSPVRTLSSKIKLSSPEHPNSNRHNKAIRIARNSLKTNEGGPF